ncbi:MAG: peptide ABC transporter substrate-binding protein [Planctomycetes bacterium]|nr:peptide ABC transporter substrate-binding protein [Planctomycetota bacterium]
MVPIALVGWAWSVALSRSAPRADFVFNSGAEVSSLDPAVANGIPEGRVIRALYEGLYTRDPMNGAAVPALAANTQRSNDGLTYTFKVRKEALWSNGDHVTAEDFRWNFERLLAPETASPFASELWCIRGGRELTTGRDAQGEPVAAGAVPLGVTTPDAETLVVELVAPTPHFLELLASYQTSPVHRASLENARRRWPDDWSTRWTKPGYLVCNGPFVLTSRRLDDRMRLSKNERYWDADRVALRTIDVVVIEDATTAFNLYRAGEIDWLDGTIPPSLVDQLLAGDDFDPQPYLGTYFYRVNTTKPPLDDPRVRRALYAAINRVAICDKFLKAGQKPAYTLVPWGRIGTYNSPPGKKEDLDGARREFEAAGFGPNGKPFGTLQILYSSSDQNRAIAEMVADGWHEYLGLDVALENQEWKSYIDRQANLQYDVSRSSWICDYPDVTNFLAVFTSDSENNRTGWKNPEYDALVEQARHLGDLGQRDQLLRQAEAILLDQLPILPIYSYVSQNMVDPRLAGFGSNALNDQNPKFWYWMDDADLERSRRKMNARERKVLSHGPKEGLYSPRAQIERKAGGRTRR